MWVSNTPKSLAQPVLGRLNRNLQRGFTLASAVSGSQFSFLNSDEVRSLTFTPKAEAVEFDGDSGKEEIEGNTHTHSLLISKQKCPQGPFLSAETPPQSVHTRACTHTHTHTHTDTLLINNQKCRQWPFPPAAASCFLQVRHRTIQITGVELPALQPVSFLCAPIFR